MKYCVRQTSAGQSYIANNWRNFHETTSRDAHMVELCYKGVSPALELAHEVGLSVPGLALAQQSLVRVFAKP